MRTGLQLAGRLVAAAFLGCIGVAKSGAWVLLLVGGVLAAASVISYLLHWMSLDHHIEAEDGRRESRPAAGYDERHGIPTGGAGDPPFPPYG